MSINKSDKHYPVMLPEVLAALSPKDGGVYVDGTFGEGGYSRAILDQTNCHVYAIDRDGNALSRAKEFEDTYGSRFTFMRGCFGDVKSLLQAHGVKQIDGFVLDVGVSSMQIDEAERGFSFRRDGLLDMRMDQASGINAADIVNNYEEEELANLIYQYGGERKSRRVAYKIVNRRKDSKFTHTLDLADVIRSAIHRSPKDKIDPATRTFQALRIAVNDELGEIERALSASIDILSPNGRIAVVSFHSLEDGMVKRFFKEKSQTEARSSRHMPQITSTDPALFELLSRKAIKPSDVEVSENPRSRSARMRVAIRNDKPNDSEGAL